MHSFMVYITVTGGQNEWAIFQTLTTKQSHQKNTQIDYQTGIYAGDVLTFQIKLNSYQQYQSPLPDFTLCQAFVLQKNLRKREVASHADVHEMQLALKCPSELQLEHWKPSTYQEYITQYDAVIQKISKFTKLPTPKA